jgi:hypothetical protein
MFDVIIQTQSNYDGCRTVELYSLFAKKLKQRVGALFAGLSSDAVCVWDTHGRLINKMLHNRKYASIAIINENEIACGGATHTIWNFYSQKKRMLFDTTKTGGVVFSPKKDILIYKHSNVIQVWNTKRNCCLTIVQLGQDQDLRLDQAETMKRINNTLMVILTNKTLTIFNYETKKVVNTISLTTLRITTSISILNEQIYVRDPGNLVRVDINTRTTLVAKTGTTFGLEMLWPTSFAYSADESIYYRQSGVTREVKRGAKGLLTRKDGFLVYQDNRNNLILFDPVLLCDEMKLVGLKGECKEFCFYFSQLISTLLIFV